MSQNITLNELEKHLSFFRKMYDVARLVDPVQKRVVDRRDYRTGEEQDICHAYLESSRICDNCISVRAYHNHNCYLKMEQLPEAIMMVAAFPIDNAGQPMVLELLKNATDTMMIGHGVYDEGYFLTNFVSELNDLVIKDELTGIYNRRFANERLPSDLTWSSLENQPLSVLFLDVDNLKLINDSYGHSVGDKVLVEVASALRDCIRSDSDWAARYGGDEFLICLNRTPQSEACNVAERIRQKISRLSIPQGDEDIRITASLGVHTTEDGLLTAEQLIDLTDRGMLRAKQKGGNCMAIRGND